MSRRQARAKPAPAPIAWPADHVERRPVAALVPYARNSRTHSDAQIAQLVASIREWGWTMPVLVDEVGGIIAGHGRVLAAQKMGLLDVPVMVARGWSEAQQRAYVIADNKLALNGGWDEDLLKAELGELKLGGFELDLIGFGGAELGKLLVNGGGLTDPDDTPAPPECPVSAVGDVWLLGSHRLVCGDCTDRQVVDVALAGVKPHLMVTDPPYGVKYNPAWRNEAERADGKKVGARALGVVLNDDRADWREAWALFPGDVCYIWHAGLFSDVVAESMRVNKFNLRAQIVWVKQRHVLSRGDYHPQHEPAFYGIRDGAQENWSFIPEHEVATYSVKKGAVGHYVGGRKQSTVWFIEHIKSDTGHGTQKPVECMKRPIENNSSPGQAVYDPFSGSGTTIIAGEMTGRSVHAIELNPAYVDVAVQRWQNFTGKPATLAAGGATFKSVTTTFKTVTAQRRDHG